MKVYNLRLTYNDKLFADVVFPAEDTEVEAKVKARMVRDILTVAPRRGTTNPWSFKLTLHGEGGLT